jgi:hypothetical protein
MPRFRSSPSTRAAILAVSLATVAAGALAVVGAGPAAGSVPPTTTTATTVPTTTTPTSTTTTTRRPTTTTVTTACDAIWPTATVLSATETTLTFSYVAHGPQCGIHGTTYVMLYTENGNYDSFVTEGSGTADTGTITISGLTPGTGYYWRTRGGGSFFSSGFSGPATTAGTSTVPPCVPATNSGLALQRLSLPAGWGVSEIVDVNAAGTVVANAYPAGGSTHAVTWDAAGTFTDLGTLPGGSDSWAVGINASGTVIGNSSSAEGIGRGVIWRQGRISQLTGPDGTVANPVAISDDGSVVGNWSDRAAGVQRPVRWDSRGRVSLLPTLAPGSSWVSTGNHSGQALGYSAVAGDNPTHVVLWDRTGRPTDLAARAGTRANDLSPGPISETGTAIVAHDLTWSRARGFRTLSGPAGSTGYLAARAVNASGAVLGSVSSGSTVAAYRWSAAGVPQALPWLGDRTSGDVADLNDSGVAIGRTSLFNAVPHGTRWSPAGAAEDLGGVTSCDRSEPVALNNAGVIAGTIRLAGTPVNASVPVVWRPVTR